MDAASVAVVALWTSFQEFRAAELPPHEDGGMNAMREWVEGPFAGFLNGHREALDHLGTQARAVAASEDPVDRLFATLVLAAAHDSFRRIFEDIPTPAELAEDTELSAIYRDALTQAATPLARLAADHYEQCSRQAAEVVPPLNEWARVCLTRGATLREAIARAPARAPAAPATWTTGPRSIAWPEECADWEPWPDDVEAPPPTTPLGETTIGVVYQGNRVPESSVRAFESALRERIRTQTGHQVLPAAEVDHAVALRAQQRLRPHGPRCGQPPPLAWILSSGRPNLVVAEAFTRCPGIPDEDDGNCLLEVHFRRPGTEDATGLPAPLFVAVLPGDDPDAWIRGAAQLTVQEVALGGIAGAWRRPPSVDVRTIGAGDSDPWLRVPRLLSEANAIFDECTPPEETRASSLHVSWSVSATGRARDVVVRPRSNADEEVAGCVRRALEGLSWPCTPAHRAQQVELTLCLGRPDLYPFGDDS